VFKAFASKLPRYRDPSFQLSREDGGRLLIRNGVGGFEAPAAAFAEIIVANAITGFSFDVFPNHLFHLLALLAIEQTFKNRVLHRQAEGF
jgi:hypothetical protein